jgi:hypothetical protein
MLPNWPLKVFRMVERRSISGSGVQPPPVVATPDLRLCIREWIRIVACFSTR